jgi:uncharacterized membrane protein (DUF2068 family)
MGMWLVAAFKLFKGLVLLAVGIGTLKLLHKDIAMEVARWADIFQIDPNNRVIHRFLVRLLSVDAATLKKFSIGTFFYSGLLLTEGTGLALRKSWAEYFTIISTGAFLPLEIYELIRRVSWPRVVVLVLNIAVVIYLIVEVRRNRG